jgi:hypothetical protein
VAESTVRWFVVREKHCWMAADSADPAKRTGKLLQAEIQLNTQAEVEHTGRWNPCCKATHHDMDCRSRRGGWGSSLRWWCVGEALYQPVYPFGSAASLMIIILGLLCL